jgi:peptidase S41-like protein
MKDFFYSFLFILLSVCFACNTSKNTFDPEKKYSPEKIKEDYSLFRNILEDSHPSLYWYTTKDSLNHYFDAGFNSIKDSMTVPQFRTLLSYTVSKINCGHTSVHYSKEYNKYLDTAKLKLFPLSIKLWGDTMVVTGNINRKDSLLKRGVIIKSINGMAQPQIRDSLFNYIVTDGYSITGKYQSLSSDFTFGSWYKNIFGLPEKLNIHYLDNNGEEKEIITSVYDPKTDTAKYIRRPPDQTHKETKKERNKFITPSSRSLQLDTVGSTAYMTVNTFARGYNLKSFFRKSFKVIDEKHIQSLVIDVRSNGGGDASNSTLLTQYLINKKFKLADSLYAVRRHSKYDKFIGKSFMYNFFMFFVTKKSDDGKYHFGYFERHYFEPKTNHHFNGQVYILIGGNSFSATTLFAGSLKGQKNITLVGEETGGSYYGNTAWMIPEVTLPNTHLRFRLPKFHLVVNKNWIKDGHGVIPDVFALPTASAIKNGIDFKAEKAHELILQRATQNQ